MNPPNYGIVLKKKLSRSGQPTAPSFMDLRTRGVSIIVKLDENSEYPDKLEWKQFGREVTYQSISQFTNASHEAQSKHIAKLIDKLITEGKWVHVHCRLGRDRAGLVVGMYRIIYTGASYNQVKKDFKKYGAPWESYQEMLKRAAVAYGPKKSRKR